MTRRATKSKGTPTDIGEDLEKLAKHIATKCLGEGLQEGEKPVPFDQEVSAFKALSNYFAMKNKLELPNETEEPFNGWSKQIRNLGERSRGNGTRAEPDATDD